MKTYHISRFKPGEGQGGVEQFATYLKRAVPTMELLPQLGVPISTICPEPLFGT